MKLAIAARLCAFAVITAYSTVAAPQEKNSPVTTMPYGGLTAPQETNRNGIDNAMFDFAIVAEGAKICHSTVKVDTKAIMLLSIVLSGENDNLSTTISKSEATSATAAQIVADSLKKDGMAKFCELLWSAYGDNGFKRPGLLHKAP